MAQENLDDRSVIDMDVLPRDPLAGPLALVSIVQVLDIRLLLFHLLCPLLCFVTFLRVVVGLHHHAELTRPAALDRVDVLLILRRPPRLVSRPLDFSNLANLAQQVGESVLRRRANLDGRVSEELEQAVEKLGEV